MAKILFPTPDAPPKRGGVARYIASVLAVRPEVALDVLPERLGTFGVLLRLWKQRRVFDVLWTSHVLPVGTACFLFSCVRPLPYTVFLHGLDFDLARRNVWKRFVVRAVLGRAHAVVANSQALAREVSVFAQRRDVQVVYPCVSDAFVAASQHTRKGLAHFMPEELAKMFVSQMASMTGAGVSIIKQDPSASVKFLTVARLVARKGHAKVLAALVHVPYATYTIVGDGPERAALEAQALALGVGNRVCFLPQVADEDLPALYASHDVFVMPTTKHAHDREGFGIVYAEAGLFGLPCIATHVPGVDEVIAANETGILIPDTPEALVDAMTTLAASPGMRSRMGSAARVRVLAHFTEAQFRVAIAHI